VWSDDLEAYEERIAVVAPDGRASPGRVVADDADSDLALVEAPEVGLPALTLAPDEPERYARVYIIGAPAGKAGFAYEGILTSKEIKIHSRRAWQVAGFAWPGSSGGAVVDDAGRLVGTTMSIFIDGERGFVPQIAGCAPLADVRAMLARAPR
jgi:S1-C subfamily serine protease